MKKYWPIILTLAGIKLLIQLAGNRNYGFHRDELLHLSVSEHLDWGYMEFPPFIAGLGKIIQILFDNSLMGMRLFPTLAGVGILILCCLMAREFGGKSKAVLLAGTCVLAFLPFYRNHTLFQPVAFDQLFWTLGYYFLIRFINSRDNKFLILVGMTLGVGLMNKYTMLIWAFGVFVGLFFYGNGKIFRNKWLYISAGISLFVFLPNMIWQVQHDYPVLQHMKTLRAKHLNHLNPEHFGLEQLKFPLTLVISLLGLAAFFTGKRLKKYRVLGVSAVVIFFTMWILNSKAYYVFAVYPVMFAGGAVKIESLLRKKSKWVYAVAGMVFVPTIPFIPIATPVLPIEQYVRYAGKQEVNGRVELTGDYADMFGWDEQVMLVDSVYRSLSDVEGRNCVIWTENYGEAGAIQILGDRYGLPDPICRHGSFWLWGYGNKDAAVWISIGNEKAVVESVFDRVELVRIIRHRYAIDEENGIPLYLCRDPKIDLETWWNEYEDHIFD